jgi:hypothetical protein
VGKATSKSSRASTGYQNDLGVTQFELDLVARMQLNAITDRLGDHNLPLCAYPASHTERV